MVSIPLPTLAWIVQRAREFDVKDGASGTPGDGDDNPFDVLEERDGDTAPSELATWIGDLSEAQQAELVALFWTGRHGGDHSDFKEYLAEAEGQQGGPHGALSAWLSASGGSSGKRARGARL